MDKVLVEIKNSDNEPIFVETTLGTLDKKFISSGKSLIDATKTFEAAMKPVITLANSVAVQLNSLTTKPDNVELEFGIKFSGEVNVWIISASGEGNINLKLSWNPGKKD
jgi:hypothetical protein